MTDKQKPVKSIRYGGINIAVFENTVTGKDGKTYVIPKITVQKTYFDKDNKPQTTTTFGLNDLPKVIAGLIEAFMYGIKSAKKGEQISEAEEVPELE